MDLESSHIWARCPPALLSCWVHDRESLGVNSIQALLVTPRSATTRKQTARTLIMPQVCQQSLQCRDWWLKSQWESPKKEMMTPPAKLPTWLVTDREQRFRHIHGQLR